MWILFIGILIYFITSKNENYIIITSLILLGFILISIGDNIMSDNISYIYLLGSLCFLAYKILSSKYFIVLKLITDCLLYMNVSIVISYEWLFIWPIIIDVLQLSLLRG
jgi:hypothetical protein